jgi:hypothetical protein
MTYDGAGGETPLTRDLVDPAETDQLGPLDLNVILETDDFRV